MVTPAPEMRELLELHREARRDVLDARSRQERALREAAEALASAKVVTAGVLESTLLCPMDRQRLQRVLDRAAAALLALNLEDVATQDAQVTLEEVDRVIDRARTIG